MHRIDTPTAQTDKFGAGKNGFTNGDPGTGRRATDLNSDMWDAVQEELCAVIEKSGLALNKAQHDQLYQAIVKIITLKIPDALLKKNNLSDLVDKSVARSNLGLGTAATGNIQVSTTDDKSGAILRVGAGGLLGEPITQSVETGNPQTWPTQSSSRFITYKPTNGDDIRGSIFLKNKSAGTLAEILVPYTGNDGKQVQVRNSSAVFTLYNNLNKPSPSDIGAYPDSGGTLRGSISTTGTISENGQRVYSPNNKPSPSDIGAYPDSGGTLRGSINTTGTISENGQRVYSPNNKPSTALLSTNGWEKDMVTGVITQWGKGRYNDSQLVNFPVSFPNAVFAVTISSDPNDNPTLTELPQAYPASNSQFRVGCATFSNGAFVASSLNCNWIAKGY